MQKMFECEDGTSFPINQVVTVSVAETCPSRRDLGARFVTDKELHQLMSDEWEIQHKRHRSHEEKLDRLKNKNKVLYYVAKLWDICFRRMNPCDDTWKTNIYGGCVIYEFPAQGVAVIPNSERKWRVVTKHNSMTISNADYEKLKKQLDRLQIREKF